MTVSGSVEHVITDEERETFSLDDDELKSAVEKYFGKEPNDAFLHSPTPWGDLYKTNDWEQVHTILTAQSAEILEITSEPTILKTQTFKNSSDHKATFDVNISESVSQTVSTSWSTSGSITVKQAFKYEVGFLGTGGGGETSFSFQASWGKGGSESKTVTVGSSAGVKVDLDPGQAVVAQLSASRGVMKIRIRYNAHLTGYTAVNYDPRYRDHHFWALPIEGVMSDASKSNSIEFIENIEVGYYSNGKIELVNADGLDAGFKEFAIGNYVSGVRGDVPN